MTDAAREPLVAADYTPLTAPLTKEEVAAFKRDAKAAGAPWAARPDLTGRGGGRLALLGLIPVLIPLLGVVFIGVMLAPVLPSLFDALFQLSSEAGFPGGLFLIGFVAVWVFVIGAAITAAVRWIVHQGYPRGWWEAALRLTRFAERNGLLHGHEEPVDYSGSVFTLGQRRTAERRLRAPAHERRFELGNYRYVVVRKTKNGTSTTVYRWGYMLIGLDRNLPHMVLDARANDRSLLGIRSTNLPVSFDRDQVLSLEGDFDQHFTLYAPKEYERDALYVFTPDLTALLIDESGDFDVEIVDDKLFVYSSTPFDLLNPATYERARRILDTVGAKTLRQTARYADERIGNRLVDQVAAPGRRLKRRTSWVAIVFIILVGGWWLWDDILSGLFG
ncbi:MAG TPA: hypothetical protein VIL55_11065, partial [Naasia sp.]